jgi:nucleotidyltransferase substrate binding protein (TIGR01987 family)
MELVTDHLDRCIKTLEASLELLRRAVPESVEYEVYCNAVVKGFELALETSGKLLRKALKEYSGSPRAVDEPSYKDVFREALKRGLIADADAVRRWFAYRDNRNSTARDYGVGFAEETLKLLPEFLVDVRKLEAALHQRFGHA